MLTGGLRTAVTMNEILAAGDVDFVGLARPFALDPDIAHKFITGTLTQSPSARVNIGVRRFDDMLQNLWYQVQLRRMGEGKEPDLQYSRYVALIKGLWTVFTT